MAARRPAGRRRSAIEMSAVTSGYGQVTSGYWSAIVIGAVELLGLITYTTAAVCELHRRRDASTRYPSSGDLTNRPGVPMIRSCGVGG